jgi:hypothetical protein
MRLGQSGPPDFGPFKRAGIGAGDGSRTRDLKFGKLVLYQLSYTRAWPILESSRFTINCAVQLARAGVDPATVYSRSLLR